MVVLAHQVGCRWLCHAAGCASSVLAGWRAILMCRGAGLQGASHILRANRSGFPLVKLPKQEPFLGLVLAGRSSSDVLLYKSLPGDLLLVAGVWRTPGMSSIPKIL